MINSHSKRRYALVSLALLTIFFNSMLQGQRVNAQADNPDGVVQLTGSVTVTNRFVLEDRAEPMMALIDLTAFIKRDPDMKSLYPDQTIASLQGDLATGAKFAMQLPIEPRAQINDVSNGKGTGKGVAVFALDFDTNVLGDAFLGPYELKGWPNGLDALTLDPGTNEVNGGRIVVWAPDSTEMFPTDFGTDGKLFTADDPVGALSAGWTVIDLDQKPFQQIRSKSVEMPVVEGSAAENDLSKLSYTAAFDALVKDLRVRYVFTEFKKINWDALVADIRPQVVKAENDKDLTEFNVAMLHFSASFHDGHLAAGLPNDFYNQQTGGGLGLVLGQTDSGDVIVRIAVPNDPADKAGIKKGATILQWNGLPIKQAIDQSELLFQNESSPTGILLAKLLFLTRSPIGTKVTVQFQNPGDSQPQTAGLSSIDERDSLYESTTYPAHNPGEPPVLPLLLQGGIGYIRINSFFGDSVLINRSWEAALMSFNDLGVTSLIIDVRANGGGSGLLASYFAGSFYTAPYELNETYQADKNGKFVYQGKDIIQPAPVQWDKPVAVLVGPDCASACEIFSAAMAHDPKHLIVGRYPTAGVEAGVAPWTLPGNISFQAPIERIQYPDGKIFLEGVGVVPNVKVPLTVDTMTSADDPDLNEAARALIAMTK
jgi:C-terminal processing protease CtpA/Prc